MSYVKTAVIVLITSMILSVILTYASVLTIIQTTEENIELTLDSFVTQNSTYIYDSIKNGNDYMSFVSDTRFIILFCSVSGLDFDGNFFYNRDKEKNVIFKHTAPYADFTVQNTLNLKCTSDLYIPIMFCGNKITDIKIPIKVQTSYNLLQ